MIFKELLNSVSFDEVAVFPSNDTLMCCFIYMVKN